MDKDNDAIKGMEGREADLEAASERAMLERLRGLLSLEKSAPLAEVLREVARREGRTQALEERIAGMEERGAGGPKEETQDSLNVTLLALAAGFSGPYVVEEVIDAVRGMRSAQVYAEEMKPVLEGLRRRSDHKDWHHEIRIEEPPFISVRRAGEEDWTKLEGMAADVLALRVRLGKLDESNRELVDERNDAVSACSDAKAALEDARAQIVAQAAREARLVELHHAWETLAGARLQQIQGLRSLMSGEEDERSISDVLADLAGRLGL